MFEVVGAGARGGFYYSVRGTAEDAVRASRIEFFLDESYDDDDDDDMRLAEHH